MSNSNAPGPARETHPLAGIRVLDMGKYIAGPYAACILAEYGADVIRIERPAGAEDRFVIPLNEGSEPVGGTYLNNNRNKRSLALELSTPEGKRVFHELLKTADVVIVNVPPSVLKSLGLDYESLCAVKPDIILGLATAYGLQGPYANRAGFDAVGQSLSGAVDLTGFPDQPTRSQAAYCDFGTALYLTIGVMAALMHRAHTGQGQQVNASLLHTGLSFISQFLTEQAMRGKNRMRTGNRGQTSGPIDIFNTRTGQILVFALGNPQFEKAARLVGRPEWIGDPRFATDELRGVHGAVLSEGLSAWCGTLTREEALAQLDEARIPAAPVLKVQEALDHEQVAANGFMQSLEFPGLDRAAPLVSLPVRLSKTPGSTRMRPPLLGEHSEQILAELGMEAAQIQALLASGIVKGAVTG